jgi:hypothetical protein
MSIVLRNPSAGASMAQLEYIRQLCEETSRDIPDEPLTMREAAGIPSNASELGTLGPSTNPPASTSGGSIGSQSWAHILSPMGDISDPEPKVVNILEPMGSISDPEPKKSGSTTARSYSTFPSKELHPSANQPNERPTMDIIENHRQAQAVGVSAAMSEAVEGSGEEA